MASDSVRPIPAAVRVGPIALPAPGVETPGSLRAVVMVLVGAGALTILVGVVLEPQRIALNLLLNSYYLLTLGLGGICFVAIHYVSGASWCVAIRRVPEAMSGVLPLAAVGLFCLFFFYSDLYIWRGHEWQAGSFKSFWLNWGFFLFRSFVYVGVWLLLSWAIIRNSRHQDQDGSVNRTRLNRRLSAVFIASFGVTFWLASFDWIMSLEPDWYSTLFAIYNFSGLFLSSLAMIVILVVWLQRLGPLRAALSADHLHDLGKLLFAFSTFWMYIWFSQYMLIWYANIPEETIYFVRRAQGVWLPLFLLTMVLNWAVPFLVLLPKRTKKDPLTMVQVSLVILAGHWLDLYLMVFPPFTTSGPVLGIWEVGVTVGSAGLFLWIVFHQLKKASVIPEKDPLLARSLSYHS